MPAALERCIEPSAQDLEDQIFCDHSLSKRKNIGVVVLARKPRHLLIPAKGAANPVDFVRDHRLAIARSSKDNAAIAFAARDCLRGRTNENRIIHRFLAESPKIFHFVAELGEKSFYLLFVTKAGVIAAKRNFHLTALLDDRRTDCEEKMPPNPVKPDSSDLALVTV
jgi:hypothetical protein